MASFAQRAGNPIVSRGLSKGGNPCYFSCSSSAFTFAEPPATVSVRSHGLKPFLLTLTECSPAVTGIDDGVSR